MDYDGIILKLNQLSNQVDICVWPIMTAMVRRWIPTVKSFQFHQRMAYQSAKKLAEFYDNFITIRRRDDTAVPLLAPNRISICAKISALACWSQHKLYASPGRDLSPGAGERLHLGTSYYDTDDATTKAFLDEVDQLVSKISRWIFRKPCKARRCWKIDADPRA